MACYTAQPTTSVIRAKQLMLFLSSSVKLAHVNMIFSIATATNTINPLTSPCATPGALIILPDASRKSQLNDGIKISLEDGQYAYRFSMASVVRIA